MGLISAREWACDECDAVFELIPWGDGACWHCGAEAADDVEALIYPDPEDAEAGAALRRLAAAWEEHIDGRP